MNKKALAAVVLVSGVLLLSQAAPARIAKSFPDARSAPISDGFENRSAPCILRAPLPVPAQNRLSAFEFAIVRFIWTGADGRDLDTRTAVISPNRNVDVGWSRDRNDGDFLLWGGDNTSEVGAEAVLIDFQALKAAYPSQSTIDIRLRGFWFGESLSYGMDGRIQVQFETYVGGTMEQRGTDFVNVGGTRVQTVTQTRQLHSDSVGGDIDGEALGLLRFNTATNTGEVIPP